MGSYEETEEAELKALYPEGSVERRVLEFSRSAHIEEEVPPILLGAFKLLMGISILGGIVGLIAMLSH
ncbi:MAG: hypothetical protein KDD69_06585 [Bdellovibrionales bacterium]|nr:hypothetical protein [Bdellovibrionales bacterium]